MGGRRCEKKAVLQKGWTHPERLTLSVSLLPITIHKNKRENNKMPRTGNSVLCMFSQSLMKSFHMLLKKNCTINTHTHINLPPYTLPRTPFCVVSFSFNTVVRHGTLPPPFLSSCLSVYTPSSTLFNSDLKKLFLVQDGNWRALVIGRSLFKLPLSGTTCLLTSKSAVLSLFSKFKTSLKTFLVTSAYSELR